MCARVQINAVGADHDPEARFNSATRCLGHLAGEKAGTQCALAPTEGLRVSAATRRLAPVKLTSLEFGAEGQREQPATTAWQLQPRRIFGLGFLAGHIFTAVNASHSVAITDHQLFLDFERVIT